MIVDDHSGMRQVLCDLLSQTFFGDVEIVECESGEQAIAQFKLDRPDCVLMDIEMQTMNGFDAIEQIRKAHESAKFIIVSSYNTPGIRKRTEELQLMGFVSKDRLSDINPIIHELTSTFE